MKQLGLKNFFILSLAKKKRVVSLETITRHSLHASGLHCTSRGCNSPPIPSRKRGNERGFGGQFYSYLPLHSLFRNTIFLAGLITERHNSHGCLLLVEIEIFQAGKIIIVEALKPLVYQIICNDIWGRI